MAIGLASLLGALLLESHPLRGAHAQAGPPAHETGELDPPPAPKPAAPRKPPPKKKPPPERAQAPKKKPSQETGSAPAPTALPMDDPEAGLIAPDEPAPAATTPTLSEPPAPSDPKPAPAPPAAATPPAPSPPSSAPPKSPSLPAPTYGGELDEQVEGSPTRAPFAVRLNEQLRGEMTIVLAGDDVYIDPEDLNLLGLKPIKGGERKTFFGLPWLSLRSISPPLRYELDEKNIELRLMAPTNLLPNTVVDLNVVPPQVARDNRTAGFVNYSLRATPLGFSGFEEIGISHEGDLASTTMFLSTANGPVRGMSTYAMNEPATLRRLSLGDALAQTGPLGSAAFIGGVTLERRLDMDPYLVRAPRLGFSGATLTPSTLEVYMNGALAKREQLPPGTFELKNLRAGGGAGQATYVIRDVFGREQRIDVPFYIANTVLRKGIDEYNYSIGVVRRSIGLKSWDYDEPAFLGRHRVGLDRNITFEGRAEATQDLLSLGPGATMLAPYGQVEGQLAVSTERGSGFGYSGFASYAYVSRLGSAGVTAQLSSPYYATVDTPAATDRSLQSVRLFGSGPIADKVSLSGSTMYYRQRDGGEGFAGDAAVGARVFATMAVSLGGTYTRDLELSTRWEVMAQLTYLFQRRHSAAASSRYANDAGFTHELSASRTIRPTGEDYGYRARFSESERRSLEAYGLYQTHFVRVGAGYGVREDTLGEADHEVGAEVSGALVVVPGIGLFPTLPVSDAFGVIQMKDVPHVRGYVNNIEVGRTDARGNLVVPAALSYYGNRFSIKGEDVPMRYLLEKEELVIAPPLRGVAIAEFKVVIPHFYRGRILLSHEGQTFVPQFGDLLVRGPKEELLSPLGKDGEFEIEGVTPGTYPAIIHSKEGQCELEFVATDSVETIIDLGTIHCELSRRPMQTQGDTVTVRPATQAPVPPNAGGSSPEVAPLSPDVAPAP